MAKLPKRIEEPPPAEVGRGNLDDPQEELVDLNFRVTKSFRKAYKQAALDHDITMRQILREAFDLWKQSKAS